jgi:hypothetical protein
VKKSGQFNGAFTSFSPGRHASLVGFRARDLEGDAVELTYEVVLFSPQPHVAKVLETTQVDQIVPVVYDLEEARRAVAPATRPLG